MSSGTGVCLSWKDLTYTVRVGKADKPVLRGLSGWVSSGRLLGVLGPSGCGKTSLINILGGRVVTGTGGGLLVNGEQCEGGQLPPALRAVTGYVAQEDVLYPCLTVRETLSVCASLRLPASTQAERKEALAAAVDAFDLNSCIDTKVGKQLEMGGVSGGERRRLAIAAESLHSPALLLLDEPTSGLDAATALLVLQQLRDRCDGPNKPTVVLSIHQPRSAIPPLLDTMLLLADGRDIYFGPTWSMRDGELVPEGGVLEYFAAAGHKCPAFESPTDFVLDLVNTRVDGIGGDALEEGNGPKKEAGTPKASERVALQLKGREMQVSTLAKSWSESTRRANALSDIPSFASLPVPVAPMPGGALGAAGAWFRQFAALFYRTFLYKLREPLVTASQFVNSVALPLVFGAVYWNFGSDVTTIGDRLAAISLVVLMQAFMAFDQLMLFSKERALYLHESKGGLYNTSVYFWARTLAECPGHIVFGFLAAAITYDMFGLRDDAEARGTYYLIVILATLAGAACLTALGSICKDVDQSMGASALLLLFMLFDGNWINKKNIPVYFRWLESISFFGYGVNSAVKNEFETLNFDCGDMTEEEDGCVPLTGQQALEQLGMEDVDVWANIGMLVMWMCIYRFLSFFGLHFCWSGEPLKTRWERLYK